jgi:hypothetical protein
MWSSRGVSRADQAPLAALIIACWFVLGRPTPYQLDLFSRRNLACGSITRAVLGWFQSTFVSDYDSHGILATSVINDVKLVGFMGSWLELKMNAVMICILLNGVLWPLLYGFLSFSGRKAILYRRPWRMLLAPISHPAETMWQLLLHVLGCTSIIMCCGPLIACSGDLGALVLWAAVVSSAACFAFRKSSFGDISGGISYACLGYLLSQQAASKLLFIGMDLKLWQCIWAVLLKDVLLSSLGLVCFDVVASAAGLLSGFAFARLSTL